MPSGTYRFETVHRVGTSSFLSGTGRGAEADDNSALWAPGPGAYGSKGFAHGLPEFGSAGFKSKRTQGRAPTPTPGPGAYTLKSTIKGTNSTASSFVCSVSSAGRVVTGGSGSSGSGFVWTRRSTAPSIPTLQLAMGYEEDADGQLVPQEAPRPPDAMPAPNRYSPSVVLTRRRPAASDFGASAGRAQPVPGDFTKATTLARSGDGLAPGTHQGMTANPRPRQPAPSAQFSRPVPQLEIERRSWEGTPGPKYDIQSGLNSVGGKLPIKTVPRQRRE